MEQLKYYIAITIVYVNLYSALGVLSTAKGATKINKDVCQRLHLDTLFSQKRKMSKKLQTSLLSMRNNNKISEKTKKHRLLVLKIMQREMNDSETLFYESIGNLKTLMKGNYESLLQLKQTSKKRLVQLQNAMVQAEDEYNMIIEEERIEDLENKLSRKFKPTKIKDYINNLFVGISAAADSLQSKLKDDTFEQEIHAQGHKIAIDTVIKVGGEEAEGSADNNEGVVMLIDSESNHFVLSKSKDSTVTHVDHVLLRDIMSVIMLSFLFMLVCNLLNLPSIFAAILAGLLLGPAGSGYVKSIVQVETIGEFGVFFFLFNVGLELSPEKLTKVLRQSLIATISILVCSIFIGLFWGRVFGMLLKQSVFVALCLSFCSTPMMTNIIEGYSLKDYHSAEEQVGDDYMNLLISMLVLQDLVLGMFMAAIPILAGHSTENHSFKYVPGSIDFHSWFHGALGGPAEELFFTVFEFVFALSGILFLTFVISKYVAGKYFRGLNLFWSHHQSFVLGILSAIFAIVTISEMIGISMELGGFICGIITGSMGDQTVKQVSQVIQPFKDFFSVLFFASIGFHVFPSFVLSEIAIFIPVTALIILTKFSVVAFILHQLLPKGNKSKWLVAIGLSQMSELSFVLGSRARRNGLIGREMYLAILSVTTLSLLVSPFMWRTVHSSVMQSGKWNIQGIVQKLRSLPISN